MVAYARLSPLVALAIVTAGCVADDSASPTAGTGDGPSAPHVVGAAGYGRGFLDVLSGTFSETPESLVVELTVSRLDVATVSQELRDAGFVEAYIGACWDPDEQGRHAECAGVTLMPSDVDPVRGAYELGRPPQEGCNDWWWCAWEVRATVTGTAPATIRVEVPRFLLPDDVVGSSLDAPIVVARGYEESPMEPFSGRTTGFSACAQGTCVGQSVNRAMRAAEGDFAGPGTSFSFAVAPLDPAVLPSPRTILVDYTHDVRVRGEERADLDIVAVEIEETRDDVAYWVTVASLPARPTHSFDMELAVAGHVYESWYRVLDGNVMDEGGGHCGNPECTTWDEHAATVEFQPGTPGRIRVGMPWAGLPEAPAGSLVTLASVDLGEYNLWIGEPEELDDVTESQTGFFVHNHGAWDIAYLAQPYHLTLGKP